MKALWIVNKCCGALHQKLYNKKATGGLWLDAMLEESITYNEDSIVVVNVEKISNVRVFSDSNVTYYTLPGKPNHRYNYKSRKAKKIWKELFDRERPDIIVLWGTEFPYGLAAMNVAANIPVVIFIQGILDSIAKYYISGLSKSELWKAHTIKDILTRTTISQIQRQYERRALYEKEIVSRGKHIIVENQWAESYFRKIYPDVIVHYMPICISNSFKDIKWSEYNMKPYTIMCSAANYPIKGLHMLLKALFIVKKRYKNVHLYIPGTVLNTGGSLKSLVKQNGYNRLIFDMIKKLGLLENITFTGRLTAEEMAIMMSKMNCFVMCSAIENHSSTLKEALTVGTPSVAAYVGGIPEYAINEYNCLLYRFEDYEVLASKIIRLFEDANCRKIISENAVQSMKPQSKSNYFALKTICERICRKGGYYHD